MKWILLTLLFSQSLMAASSKVVPIFLEASEMYVKGISSSHSFYVSNEIRAVLQVLEKSQIGPEIIEKYTNQKTQDWTLRENDEFDSWTQTSGFISKVAPEVVVHALKLDVHETSDDFFKDDIYAYFFVTDGVVPTGKVTSVYKGISSKQSFFFNEIDRSIFPLTGIQAKSPDNHLIIDYGIIESDGDDIKEMKKLSSIIIDIAIAVYSSYDPQRSKVIINLRKEIKALSDMLLNLNHDDRLATGTIGYKAAELADQLKDRSFMEIKKNHQGNTQLNTWNYDLSFRILRK
jgi:hypothetical protein